ncbi:MAG: hypothetical protein RR614_14330, partial [Eubacterium sp.]
MEKLETDNSGKVQTDATTGEPKVKKTYNAVVDKDFLKKFRGGSGTDGFIHNDSVDERGVYRLSYLWEVGSATYTNSKLLTVVDPIAITYKWNVNSTDPDYVDHSNAVDSSPTPKDDKTNYGIYGDDPLEKTLVTGDVVPDILEKTGDQPADTVPLTDPSRTGYQFVGWSKTTQVVPDCTPIVPLGGVNMTNFKEELKALKDATTNVPQQPHAVLPGKSTITG